MADEHNEIDSTEVSKDTSSTYIVGLGASAGGLEALQQFFSALPDNSGMAFVVVQHLSPDYKSMMVELLSKTTSMPVLKVENGMEINPDHVYIIPPKTQMTIYKGKLFLEESDYSKGLLLPIDTFLKSLADDQGEKSIGIILSGTGSDGTRGITAIKGAGGMAMVQQEDTAKFSGMPGSAIATGMADYIQPPDKMPEILLSYIKHPYLTNTTVDVHPLLNEDTYLNQLLSTLRDQSGVDFSLYKPSTILRRIERRMGIAQVVSLEEYLRYIKHSPDEAKALYKDLLISVTRFFRDLESYNELKEKVIPQMVNRAEPGKTLRIWVAGCATGEEAYSLAILFADYLEKSERKCEVKVFATDIEKEAMEYASRGIYPESIAADLPEPQMRRFFTKEGGSLKVNTKIRQMVVFASHNLISDPPFNKMDMVSCRNLLIYLKPAQQQRVLKVFSFALYPQGYLFLGSSETIGEMTDSFDTLSVKHKLFRHRGTVKPVLSEGINSIPMHERLTQRGQELKFTEKPAKSSSMDSSIEEITRKIINEKIPACLVIDPSGTLVHSFGSPSRFLKTPTGKATLNVLEMVPREIALLISSAVNKVIKTVEPMYYSDIKLNLDEESLNINLSVEPYVIKEDNNTLLLIFIEESYKPARGESSSAEELDFDEKVSQRINELELELQLTKENLQATIEELETSNEELQATNEELLASNEELQSTNEELQSVNEELYTVNAEYQDKINELAELNNDMQNLLSSTNIGKIFLDSDLRIRKFTPPITAEIELLPHDEGRRISDFSHPFLQAIAKSAHEVMKNGKQFDQVFKTKNGQVFLLRQVPYKTESDLPDGTVSALIDITTIKDEVKCVCE